jgi:2-desacetyl-2-hydroxyethyl bacteriochlorophyllide A dehydrogenase
VKAIVYHGPHDFRIESVPDPGIESDTDVLLEVERTAICGSDLHLWHMEGYPENGFTVGHEFLGTVAEAGPAVQRFKKGDRVFVACTSGCGTCAACRQGLYSGCPVTTRGFTVSNIFGFGSQLPGGQAEAVRVPFADANCFALPRTLTDEQCLFLTDILPTAYMGTELAEVGPGDRVVVFGCGPVGTFAQRCAQLRGASVVIAVDLDDARLARARERGCETIQPERESLGERVLELTDGRGADATIEAVGVPDLITQAAFITRAGGSVAVIGVILQTFEVPWPLFFQKNLSLRTGLVNPQTHIPRLLPLIERGRIDPTEIITHRFPLEEGPGAYQTFAEHKDNVLKVVLSP